MPAIGRGGPARAAIAAHTWARNQGKASENHLLFPQVPVPKVSTAEVERAGAGPQ
jgi:hypothetical protein